MLWTLEVGTVDIRKLDVLQVDRAQGRGYSLWSQRTPERRSKDHKPRTQLNEVYSLIDGTKGRHVDENSDQNLK